MVPRSRLTVAIALLPGMPLFEVAVPCEVFGTPRPGLVEPAYRVLLCAGEPSTDLGTAALRVDHGWSDLAAAGTVVVPALASWDADVPDLLVQALRDAHAAGARVIGLCTGAFALGAAGLLDGLDATTHWMYADQLARRFPQARVDPTVLWAGDDRTLTSAGTASGLDLCLEVLRRDRGAAVGNEVARRMVVAPHRQGGQAQFIHHASPPSVDRSIAPALDWGIAHLHEEVGPTELAAAAHVSVRTLSRRFQDSLGTSPRAWIAAQRVRRVQELLETTDFPVTEVAAMAGFASPSTMRTQFSAHVGTSPQAYRRTFNPTAS